MGVMHLHDLRGGRAVKGTAGEDLAKYDLVYLKSGTWWKADKDTVETMPAVGLCTGAIRSGDSNYILLWGIIGNLDWEWVDGAIYASSVAGGLTQETPTDTAYAQSVGVSYGATFMLFVPMWVKQPDTTFVVTDAPIGKKRITNIWWDPDTQEIVVDHEP